MKHFKTMIDISGSIRLNCYRTITLLVLLIEQMLNAVIARGARKTRGILKYL